MSSCVQEREDACTQELLFCCTHACSGSLLPCFPHSLPPRTPRHPPSIQPSPPSPPPPPFAHPHQTSSLPTPSHLPELPGGQHTPLTPFCPSPSNLLLPHTLSPPRAPWWPAHPPHPLLPIPIKPPPISTPSHLPELPRGKQQRRRAALDLANRIEHVKVVREHPLRLGKACRGVSKKEEKEKLGWCAACRKRLRLPAGMTEVSRSLLPSSSHSSSPSAPSEPSLSYLPLYLTPPLPSSSLTRHKAGSRGFAHERPLAVPRGLMAAERDDREGLGRQPWDLLLGDLAGTAADGVRERHQAPSGHLRGTNKRR
jgi:hypothetical protein